MSLTRKRIGMNGEIPHTVVQQARSPSTRVLWPDLVRVCALFAVIVLHVAAVPVTHFRELPLNEWWWANAYDSLVRPCIPLFVMLSGALLLTTSDWNARNFVRRRVVKVVIPFLAWSAIYAAWNCALHGQTTSVARFLRHLAGGMGDPVQTHLWYLPLILSLYLLLPIVRIYTTNSSIRNQLYFALLWLFVTVVRPWIEAAGVPIGFYLDPLFGFIGYFVLGATIWTFVPRRLEWRWCVVAGVAFIGGYAVTAIGTYELTVLGSGDLDETYYSNLAPNVMLMSVSAFVLLRHLGTWLEERRTDYHRTVRVLGLASEASFGAYLIHMIVLDTLGSGLLGFTFSSSTGPTAVVVPLLSIAALVGSFVFATIMRKSRFLRWLVP